MKNLLLAAFLVLTASVCFADTEPFPGECTLPDSDKIFKIAVAVDVQEQNDMVEKLKGLAMDRDTNKLYVIYDPLGEQVAATLDFKCNWPE